MTSAAEIRRRTAEKLGRAVEKPARPPAAAPAQLPPELLCITPGCGRRWTCNLGRGKRCSDCDARFTPSPNPTRPLFPPSTTTEETPDDPALPF